MLRSSGFFRGVECPFGAACGRPYCPFRHPPTALQAGAPAPAPDAFPSGRPGPSRRSEASECGYDPYRPELPKATLQSRNGALEELPEPSTSILELELVNQAIEVVRNEVEREQKKYEELLETKKEYGSSEAAKSAGSATPGPFPTLEYTPGSYGNADYNPTPLAAAAENRCSKYTLHPPEKAKSKGSLLEYVPTVVTQPKKYVCPARNNKYTIDSSKPSTDLEYDPLSNYSARLLSKVREQKGTKRKRAAADPEEAYSPSLKKHCDAATSAEPLARFSDSEEEPEAAASAPPKSGSSADSKASGETAAAKEREPQSADSLSRRMKETAVQYDMGDIESMPAAAAKRLPEKGAEPAKEAERNEEAGKEKPKKKSADSRKAEDKKKQAKEVDREKARLQHRNGERRKEKSGKPHADGHPKAPGKAKPEKAAGTREENRGAGRNFGKHSSAEKSASGKKEGKWKAGGAKNKTDSRRAESHERKEKKPPSKGPGKALAKGHPEVKQRTLSHVDLFGDESGDDAAEPLPVMFPEVSSDSEGDGRRPHPSPRGNGAGSLKRARRPLPAPSPPPSSSSSSDEVDYSVLEREMDFESDPMEECLRIFNESTDVKTEDKGRLGKQQPPKEDAAEEKARADGPLTTLFPGQKRRISHVAKQGSTEPPSKPVVRPYRPPTAQEVCYQRIQLAQEQAAQLTTQAAVATHKGEKKRIAHVPHVGLPTRVKPALANHKKTSPLGSVGPSNGSGAPALKSRTLAGMASKTTTTNAPKRIAHAPTLQSATLKRPVIPTEFGAKVPTNIRQRYLNLFIDECLKSCCSQQEAFDKALLEEKLAYERSTSRNIYLNVAVNTLKKLRNLLPNSSQNVQKTSNHKVVSHEAMLGGKLAAKTSFTLNRSVSLRVEDLTGPILYRRLKEYVLTEEELKEHGYPLPSPEKNGRAVVFTAEEKKPMDSSCRVCCRCGTEYMVTASGNCVRKEECVHHWGKLRKQRVPGGWETHYNCCSGAVGSPGCQVAKQHVHDGRKDKLDNFVKTFEKLPNADAHPGIFALDCEMCYTKQGLELTRVTVIDAELKVVYDTFVKPDCRVVDYNTRFSGVTEADLENATITLRDVQAVLLNMFSADTILIGHSLESDLFALKLIHCTVVDTAVVFPHRLGLPYKRALRTLMADYLKRIIQDSVEGHDSSEDARACMELMIWKIKEDAKVKR